MLAVIDPWIAAAVQEPTPRQDSPDLKSTHEVTAMFPFEVICSLRVLGLKRCALIYARFERRAFLVCSF
jgi:hypothetical protein